MPSRSFTSSALNNIKRHPPSNDRCNIVDAKLADFHCKALIDTGAVFSLMSVHTFEKLKAYDHRTSSRSVDYYDYKPSLATANRQLLNILTGINTHVQIGGMHGSTSDYVYCRIVVQ